MIPEHHNFLIIRLRSDGRKLEFAPAPASTPPDCVEQYPKSPHEEFCGFVDMLRIEDGNMVGLRFYFFEGFDDMAIHLDRLPGVTLSESYIDIFFTDHRSALTAQPNAEQLLGGIRFFVTDAGEVTVSFDFSHLSLGCRMHLKEVIETDYRELG